VEEQDGRSLITFGIVGFGWLRSVVMDLDRVAFAEDVGGGSESARRHLRRGRHLGRGLPWG
jgi:hypothetical protein